MVGMLGPVCIRPINSTTSPLSYAPRRFASLYSAEALVQQALPRRGTPLKTLPHLFENNRAWAEAVKCEDPDFFTRLARQQSPRYLWIGCADSRADPSDIFDTAPGELFTARNVANTVYDREFSIAKARDHLGYEPQVELAHGVAETVQWFLDEERSQTGA